nr:DUF4123 domain-containing protein [Acinetobacter sp. Marseille-Q1620]
MTKLMFELEQLQFNDQLDLLVSEKINKIFEKRGHIYFSLDRTLDPSAFDEVLELFQSNDIEYIPLGITKNIESSNLILIRIQDKSLLDKASPELIRYFIQNKEIENDRYFVTGFGSSHLDIEELRDHIKRRLVVEDQGKKILFRWYDPRVIIYLDQIFKPEQLKSLFLYFNEWSFLHPTGFYFLNLDEDQKIRSLPIQKLSDEQSIALDLIEIANLVYQKLNDFDEIEIALVNPISIHTALLTAYNEYKLLETEHLIAYGLYSQIIHPDFMQHPLVIDVLYEHCIEKGQDFISAMEVLEPDLYAQIKKNLEG